MLQSSELLQEIRSVVAAIENVSRSQVDLGEAEVEQLHRRLVACIDAVNSRLQRCDRLLRNGLKSEAIREAEVAPRVQELVDGLVAMEFWDDWIGYVRQFGIPPQPNLMLDTADALNIVYSQPRPSGRLSQPRHLPVPADGKGHNSRPSPGIAPPIPPLPPRRRGEGHAPLQPQASGAAKSPNPDRNVMVAAIAVAGVTAFAVVMMFVLAGIFFLSDLWNPSPQIADKSDTSPVNSGTTIGKTEAPSELPSSDLNLPVPSGPPVEARSPINSNSGTETTTDSVISTEDPGQPNKDPASTPGINSSETTSGAGQQVDIDHQQELDPKPTVADAVPETKSFTVPDVLHLSEYEGTTTDPVVLLEAAPGSSIENLNLEYVKEIRDDVAGLRGISSSGKSGKVNISAAGFPNVANFIIEDNKILFHWNAINLGQGKGRRGMRLLGNGLRWCQLNFEVDGEPHTCRLSNPRSQATVEFQPVTGGGLGVYVADLTTLLDSRTPERESLELQGTPTLVDDDIFVLSPQENPFFVFEATLPFPDPTPEDPKATKEIPVLQIRVSVKGESNGDLRLEAKLRARQVGDLLNREQALTEPSWRSPTRSSLSDALAELAAEEKRLIEEGNDSQTITQFNRWYLNRVQMLFEHLQEMVEGDREIKLTDFRLQLNKERFASSNGGTAPIADLLVVGRPEDTPADANDINVSSPPP